MNTAEAIATHAIASHQRQKGNIGSWLDILEAEDLILESHWKYARIFANIGIRPTSTLYPRYGGRDSNNDIFNEIEFINVGRGETKSDNSWYIFFGREKWAQFYHEIYLALYGLNRKTMILDVALDDFNNLDSKIQIEGTNFTPKWPWKYHKEQKSPYSDQVRITAYSSLTHLNWLYALLKECWNIEWVISSLLLYSRAYFSQVTDEWR